MRVCSKYSAKARANRLEVECTENKMQRSHQCCGSAALKLSVWIPQAVFLLFCTVISKLVTLLVNRGSLIRLPSVCICLIAPGSPCHLTVISTDNISMDFPAETGFKRHVSEMFDSKRDLFLVFMGCAIHFKRAVRSFRSF